VAVAQRLTEGARGAHDGFGRGARISEHFRGWNAQDVIALGRQIAIPLDVARWTVAHIVRNPIDFDHELRSGAVEVSKVRADGVLFAKADSAGLALQLSPEKRFGER
jgi:hypothetical protein